MTLAAYIPARFNSKRIVQKNIRPFFGHPLIAYAISSALDCALFGDHVYVSSDSDEVGRISEHYGARFIRRPVEFSGDTSPDAEWIAHAQGIVQAEAFAILRPTSPFRTAATIIRAFTEWDEVSHLKAVEPAQQHPGKMWSVNDGHMAPLWEGDGHLNQTITLPRLYVQNASLEFRTARPMTTFQPFVTEGREGHDLNVEDDFILAEALVEHGLVQLPRTSWAAYV